MMPAWVSVTCRSVFTTSSGECLTRDEQFNINKTHRSEISMCVWRLNYHVSDHQLRSFEVRRSLWPFGGTGSVHFVDRFWVSSCKLTVYRRRRWCFSFCRDKGMRSGQTRQAEFTVLTGVQREFTGVIKINSSVEELWRKFMFRKVTPIKIVYCDTVKNPFNLQNEDKQKGGLTFSSISDVLEVFFQFSGRAPRLL